MNKKLAGATIKHDFSKAPKTGNWRNVRPIVDKEKCTGCGTCVKYCPEAVINLRERRDDSKFKKLANVDMDFCKGCGVCAVECPFKAIKMEKE
ncbi:MAG: 4Fe-4S binding protein [Candidatus Moranbacteria bacterium]|jgi:2-oxoacid:acceptor oxidoreductase delta subunit (pyruvate/2-ketoisovalerate family)|nr:4Fe-4S binding protein [Candidatus Moranbacteria bacterium]